MKKKKEYIPGNCSHPKKTWEEFNREWREMVKDHKRVPCENCGIYNQWVKK